jgi:DUF4097 and DUF4098 domain-containing protein YvlB
MKNTALAILLIALVAAPAAAQGKETETVDRTVPFSNGGTVRLKNFSGDARITGTSSNEVVVHAIRKGTRQQLDNIKLDIQTTGSTIEIEANQRSAGWGDHSDNVVETEFEIQVPVSTELDLHAFSGNLIVRGTTGRIEAKTFSGDVDLDVSTASAAPDVKAETFSGDISAKLPEVANGHVRFNSFSGDFRSDFPVLLSSKSRRDISVDIGGGSGATLEFKTFSGDLKLVK